MLADSGLGQDELGAVGTLATPVARRAVATCRLEGPLLERGLRDGRREGNHARRLTLRAARVLRGDAPQRIQHARQNHQQPQENLHAEAPLCVTLGDCHGPARRAIQRAIERLAGVERRPTFRVGRQVLFALRAVVRIGRNLEAAERARSCWCGHDYPTRRFNALSTSFSMTAAATGRSLWSFSNFFHTSCDFVQVV
jgi:hypothetical protein